MRKIAMAIATAAAILTTLIPACVIHTPGMGTFSCDLKVDGPGYGHVQCERIND